MIAKGESRGPEALWSGAGAEPLRKEVTRMNCIANRRVGAVTHMSRL